MPQFKSVPDKMYELPQPGMGGINLKDLEFEQDPNQSPYMKNVMYRNGAFSKRYGQEYLSENGEPIVFGDVIYDAIYYDGKLYVDIMDENSGEIKYYEDGTLHNVNGDAIPNTKGKFMIFNQKLYYFNGDGISWAIYEIQDDQIYHVDPYVPDALINCEPDGSYNEQADEFNVLTDAYDSVYNADGTSVKYYLYDPEEAVEWSPTYLEDMGKVYVDDVLLNQTADYEFGQDSDGHYIQFHIVNDGRDFNIKNIGGVYAPDEGNMNVVVTLPIKEDLYYEIRQQIFNSKVYAYYGGRNDSRLFLAGNGRGKVFWSNVDDVSYFPENNWMVLGNSEEDITGLARQYNILVAFKPNETYSI